MIASLWAKFAPMLVALTIVVALGAILMITYSKGVRSGRAEIVAEYNAAALEQRDQIKTIREEIESEAPPPSADRTVNLQWLRTNACSECQ